jgi:DNA topoisomerase III
MYKLIIAEKSSAAKSIAQAILPRSSQKKGYIEGGEYLITHAVGHLIGLAEPDQYSDKYKKWNLEDLPILPFSFKLTAHKNTFAQLKVIQELAKRSDVTEIINAADSGREGELIFNWIIQYLRIQKPVKRLWTSSLTPEAIRKAFQVMKDGKEYHPLFLAAKARAESDWIIGMNGTRALSTKHGTPGQPLSVGRVQTPVLAMIVDRQEEIENFTKEPFFEVKARFRQSTTVYEGIWQGERIKERSQAEAISNSVVKKPGTITAYENKTQREAPPKLYDLTLLQRDANKKYGFSAARTLAIAQKLYESKQITYPRTNSKYVDKTMIPHMHKVFALLKVTKYAPFVDKGNPSFVHAQNKAICDETKIEDHHAILPTEQLAKNLGAEEEKIYDLLVRRFLAQFYPPAEYQRHVIGTTIVGEFFKTTMKQLKTPGWKVLYNEEVNPAKKKQAETEEKEIQGDFHIDPNQTVFCEKAKVVDKETQPPPFFDEASLLLAMETCGKLIEDEELRAKMKGLELGTPATRGPMIEMLKSRGYIQLSGKKILATPKGKGIIDLVRKSGIGLLTSPGMTGKWELYLSQIAKGKAEATPFLERIKEFAKVIVNQVKQQEKTNPILLQNHIGACPTGCGGQIVEGSKGYGCNRWKEGCKFTIWKKQFGKTLSIRNIQDLLTKGKTAPLKFKKKDQSTYSARILLKEKWSGKTELEFIKTTNNTNQNIKG